MFAEQFVTIPGLRGGYMVNVNYLHRFHNVWITHQAKIENKMCQWWQSFNFPNTDWCRYVSQGSINQEVDFMMSNRPEFGLRPLSTDNKVSVVDIK